MSAIKIIEVAPRDGLQNETALIPTPVKVAFVEALADAGVDEIEVSSFVSPRKVPQLADAGDVFRGIRREDRILYSALVPNERGLDRALDAGVDKISVFTAASETFNQRNVDASVKESLRRFQPLIRRAREAGLPVRGYLSTAFWCAFEGPIAPSAVADLAQRLIGIGVDEIAVSDTIGKATPAEVARLFDILLPGIAPERIAVHFHDTYGCGVANALASWSYGIRSFDGSAGGLGGCPFAPGATGNVATEALVAALAGVGGSTGVDLAQFEKARRLVKPFLREERRPSPGGGSPACAACEYNREGACRSPKISRPEGPRSGVAGAPSSSHPV